MNYEKPRVISNVLLSNDHPTLQQLQNKENVTRANFSAGTTDDRLTVCSKSKKYGSPCRKTYSTNEVNNNQQFIKNLVKEILEMCNTTNSLNSSVSHTERYEIPIFTTEHADSNRSNLRIRNRSRAGRTGMPYVCSGKCMRVRHRKKESVKKNVQGNECFVPTYNQSPSKNVTMSQILELIDLTEDNNNIDLIDPSKGDSSSR